MNHQVQELDLWFEITKHQKLRGGWNNLLATPTIAELAYIAQNIMKAMKDVKSIRSIERDEKEGCYDKLAKVAHVIDQGDYYKRLHFCPKTLRLIL